MASVTKENIGNLHDKLTVKITKEDYLPSFEKAIKEYSKKANIPGFRKGMVPAGMIRKMYGSSIFYEEVTRSVEKELKEYLTTENPSIFAQPLPMQSDLRSLDLNNPADYEFPFEIGLKPEVQLDVLKTASTTLYKVRTTPEMINEEVEKLVSKNGNLQDAETVTNAENVLNVLFEESDAEGNLIPEPIVKDNSILVKYFTPEFQEKLQGKKAEDSLVLQIKDAFPEKEGKWILSDLGLENDPNGAEKYFKMTITKIGLLEKAELNEEFFNKVFPGKELKTEEDFRKALEEDIQKQWDAAATNQLHDQIYHLLMDAPIELPEEFLKRWLATNGEKEKTPEEVEAEYPNFANQLKWTLISDKIIGENNLQVSEQEIRNGIKNDLMGYFGQANLLGGDMSWLDSYVDRVINDNKQVDQTYRKLITEKLFNWLGTQVTPAEKEISSEEFLAMQHHHSH